MVSLVSWTAIFAATVTAAAALWQVSLLRRSLGTDALLHLDDRWQGMNDTRKKASSALIKGINPRDNNPDLDDVLDFFEGVALLMRRRVIDKFVGWHFFYWSMASYCAKSQDYIRDAQQREGKSVWRDLEWALGKLKKIESRQSERPIGSVAPSGEQIEEVLKGEAEPEPETDVRRS